MHPFDYRLARSVDEVIATLASDGDRARVLCGGTDLLVQLREGRRSVDLVVDIKQIAELNALEYTPDDGLRLGAAVPCYKIAGDSTIARVYPGLVEAVGLIGGVQIQGRASVGGNLCNASPAADSIPALIVHRAVCAIAGPDGWRNLPVEQFCIAPGRTALRPGEILVAVLVPTPPPRSGAAYLRFTPRNEMDIAVAGAGAAVTLDPTGATFVSARVALGAVAPTPLLVQAAGDALIGRAVSEAALDEAAHLAQAAARPIDDVRGTVEQRIHLAGVLTRRALVRAIARARVSM